METSSSKPAVLYALTDSGILEAASTTPFAATFALGKRHAARGMAIAVVGTLLLHGGVGVYGLTRAYDLTDFAHVVRNQMAKSLASSIDIEIQKEPEPPAPEPEPPAPKPEPTAEPSPPEKAPPVLHKAPPPPPAAAQAAPVLTAKPNPDEPIDLTGNSFVTGNAESFPGGITASNGTSKDAVSNRNAAPNGVVGGTGKGTTPAADLSAPVRLVSNDWQCPFPEEADIEQINYTRVPVMVSVEANGRAKSVQVLKDPGFGFARQARACALRQTYKPALDRSGNPIAQTVGPINITFTR